jgi:LPXTG-site transpeptidase (sortase) family protein
MAKVVPHDGPRSSTSSISGGVRVLLYVVAVGLIATAGVMFYLAYADDLRFSEDQAQLAASLPSAVPATPTLTVEPTGTLDFTGWEELDVAYWKALKTGGAFARLVVADAGVDDVAVKGAGTAQLAKAPGWIVQTDMPGPEGNCAISGHRVTHGHPFRNLDRVKVGATIDLYSPFRLYRYEVDRILRVTPDHVEVIAHTAVPHLTFTTCDPPGRAVKRLVVQARLVEVVRLSGAAKMITTP